MKGLMKRGNTWYIRYSFEGKDKWEAIGPSKRQAELVLAKRKIEIREGRYFSTPKGLKWSYGQLLDRYLEYARVTKKPSTYKRTDCVFSKPLREAFGNLLLKDITPSKVTTYMQNKLADGLKAATVRHHLMLLKHSLSLAVKWDLLPTNPLRDVRLPVKVNNARLRYLAPEEIDRLLSVCSLRLKRLVQTALHTGMRKSEILKLEWAYRDERTLAYVNLDQRMILLLDTKNGDKRGVPLTDTLVNMLREIKTEQEQIGLASPWVFPNPATGAPYRHDIKTAWYTALRKAGIADFRFHDLRHTCASHLRMQGVDLLTIAEILGHKDLAMTRRYAHVAPAHRHAAVNLLERAYSTSESARIEQRNADDARPNESKTALPVQLAVAKSVADTGNIVIEHALSS